MKSLEAPTAHHSTAALPEPDWIAPGRPHLSVHIYWLLTLNQSYLLDYTVAFCVYFSE